MTDLVDRVLVVDARKPSKSAESWHATGSMPFKYGPFWPPRPGAMRGSLADDILEMPMVILWRWTPDRRACIDTIRHWPPTRLRPTTLVKAGAFVFLRLGRIDHCRAREVALVSSRCYEHL